MTTEQVVAQHYGREGLEQAILAALAAAGKDVADLSPDDLAGIDEFHLGWRAQTVSLAERLGLGGNDHVLDIG
ncbi:MAG: class I SAM-dependent methyltransferase, partial [Rhodospirillaceae bacterium]|nr:class I SAM-dependent methyltransferase [Rhodospirillaceae bacterium]